MSNNEQDNFLESEAGNVLLICPEPLIHYSTRQVAFVVRS